MFDIVNTALDFKLQNMGSEECRGRVGRWRFLNFGMWSVLIEWIRFSFEIILQLVYTGFKLQILPYTVLILRIQPFKYKMAYSCIEFECFI